jgi:hypothetical protein
LPARDLSRMPLARGWAGMMSRGFRLRKGRLIVMLALMVEELETG